MVSNQNLSYSGHRVFIFVSHCQSLYLHQCAFPKIPSKHHKAKIHATGVKMYCLSDEELFSVTLGYMGFFFFAVDTREDLFQLRDHQNLLDQLVISTM